MKMKALMCGLLGTVALGAGATTIVLSNNTKKLEPVSAAVPTNTRRVWVIDNNNLDDGNTNWWTGSTLYADVEGVSGSIKATKVLDDYYKGFWYFDVTVANATTGLNVIMRVGDNSAPYAMGNNNQTFTQPLGEFGEADTIWLNGGVSWDQANNRKSRSASIGTTNGFSGAQLAALLSHYDTCSSSNTDGFNAYPQLETNVFLKTAQSAFSTPVLGDTDYTCQDYVDGMYARYNANK